MKMSAPNCNLKCKYRFCRKAAKANCSFSSCTALQMVCCYFLPAGNAQTAAAPPHFDLSDKTHLTSKKKKKGQHKTPSPSHRNQQELNPQQYQVERQPYVTVWLLTHEKSPEQKQQLHFIKKGQRIYVLQEFTQYRLKKKCNP